MPVTIPDAYKSKGLEDSDIPPEKWSQLEPMERWVCDLITKGYSHAEIKKAVRLPREEFDQCFRQICRVFEASDRMGILRRCFPKRKDLIAVLEPNFPLLAQTVREEMRVAAKESLTEPENGVVRVLNRDGGTNKDIADLLGVSEHTVADRLKRIYRKLGVGSRIGVLQQYFPPVGEQHHQRVREKWGLTAPEARALVGCLQFGGVAEGVRGLHANRHTVADCLKHAYAKMGVGSLAQAFVQVASLPVTTPPAMEPPRPS